MMNAMVLEIDKKHRNFIFRLSVELGVFLILLTVLGLHWLETGSPFYAPMGWLMYSVGMCTLLFATVEHLRTLMCLWAAGFEINIKDKEEDKYMRKTYRGLIKELKPNQIFVFGSNPEGKHGGGAARVAYKKFGARYGVGRGLQGQSYALPTKNLRAGYYEPDTGITYAREGEKSIPSSMIVDNICDLYGVAELNPDMEFLIAYTAEGFLLNGYTPSQMAVMFLNAGYLYGHIPENIVFEDKFYVLITDDEDNITKGELV